MLLKQGITALVALPFLCCSLALAQDANQPDGKAKGEWHQRTCTERYARKAAGLTYLEAKLNLTEQQKPAWGKWRQVKLDAAEKQRSACVENEPKQNEHGTVLDRQARIEKALSTRLQNLETSKPALQALYESLSPEQKIVFDQSQRWQGHRRGHDRHGEGH